MNSETSSSENERSEIRLVEAVINLDSWLLQKNLENALTSPVFLEGKIWEVKGEIVPNSFWICFDPFGLVTHLGLFWFIWELFRRLGNVFIHWIDLSPRSTHSCDRL